MGKCYLLREDKHDHRQTPDDDTFIGGVPRLPADAQIPRCGHCGSEMTFYFQVAWPEGSPLPGYSFACFACTSCDGIHAGIPECVSGAPLGAEVPEGLCDYTARRYAYLSFPTTDGRPALQYTPRVVFKRWLVRPATTASYNGVKIGGVPTWAYEDYWPATICGQPAFFLMQIPGDYYYEPMETAPPQMVYDCFKEKVVPCRGDFDLFLANWIYFFGSMTENGPKVYAIVQKP
jgi:hypothetical protein